MIGQTVAHYRITDRLGAGGMGEVYRARDTRLNRDVAIKVLPELFASDPERLARFEREAQLLAALNHPNIAQVHGLEDAPGTRALVMEFVDGPTLADRIGAGAIGLEESVAIARQIADALEAAHEQGIVHRDLKPANIKLRPDGTVKVLDFGLAKALDTNAPGSGAGASHSPTITSPATMTRLGVILGTAAYMAPEQARGKAVDKRADVWAFGAVLYEMLTGARAFAGDEVSDTLAFVITKDPDWSRLPASTPVSIHRLLRRCLEKDRRKRLADVSDARLELDESPAAASQQPSSAGWRVLLPWAVAFALGLGLLVPLGLWSRRTTPPAAPLRLSAGLGADVSLATDPGASLALSPDGTVLAFVARPGGKGQPQLYLRRLDQLQATAIQRTEGAGAPFFSPDGQWVAFFADGRLKKVAVAGGAAVALCDAPSARGGTWAEDGTIVFTPITARSGLMRVPSGGGQAEPLTTLADGEATQRWPQWLPGGDAVLYTSHAAGVAFDDATVMVQRLPNGPRKVVRQGGYHGRYLASGHVVYVRQGTLFAIPFDRGRLEPLGDPVPVFEGVASLPRSGGAEFDVSATGVLAYLVDQGVGAGTPISWLDRQGNVTPLRATPADWINLRFDPDGNRLAMDVNDGRQSDVWIYEWARGALVRLTTDPNDDRHPVWSPGGGWVAFSRYSANGVSLYAQRSDRAGEALRLTENVPTASVSSWHPSGKVLAFTQSASPGTKLMLLPLEGDEGSGWKPGKPIEYVSSPFAILGPTFSPDGKWLAYGSPESGGRSEVFVVPFPQAGRRTVISTSGGQQPKWSRTRSELFYATSMPDARIMVVPYTVRGEAFVPEKPRAWSPPVPMLQGPFGFRFDLHPDGNRVATPLRAETDAPWRPDTVVVVSSFFDELRRIAPARTR